MGRQEVRRASNNVSNLGFQLDQVVPWGRSMSEYYDMFSLASACLPPRILSVADGPASFNAELHSHPSVVISADPIYRFGPVKIQERILATFEQILAQVRENRDSFVWERIADPESLGHLRMQAMNRFLDHFQQQSVQSRYIAAELPWLPVRNQAFDLCLCSHFLFLYSDQLDRQFHLKAVEEMLRVAREVRIFPLLDLSGKQSDHIEPVARHVVESGWSVEIVQVDYEFQRGGNQMMRIINNRGLSP